MVDWLSVFAAHRVVSLRREEIVQGILHPGLGADAPRVREFLHEWEGARFARETPAGTELTLVRRTGLPVRERWWLHVVLFVATLFTTTLSGAFFARREPLAWTTVPVGPWEWLVPERVLPAQLVPGLWFSVPLLAILLAHEMGHYLAARRLRMDVSPPYFIPLPLLSVIGTLGAFIRLRSPMLNRAALLDVGAAGPLAGFVLAVPLAAVGLRWSGVDASVYDTPTRFQVPFGAEADGLWVGGSLLFRGLAHLFAGPGVVVLHPLAIAGWLGLFVTALNLLPLSQLDGGHVLYALAGRAQRFAAMAFLGVLLVLGWWWMGWWLWAGLVLVVGRGSVAHPRVFDTLFPVAGARRVAGWACVAIFALTFVAVPFTL